MASGNGEQQQMVGKYKIEKLLYEGSAVKVFEGESDMRDRVAIKQCKKENSQKEVDTLLTLKRWDSNCNHVVKILDCINMGSADETAATLADSTMSSFLVFELGDTTLDAWLRDRRFQPSWAEVLEVGHALGQALDWLHSHDLAHSDVKPANCMLIGRQWKLVDFAAATKEGGKCTELTSTYVAPEQARAYLAGREVLASKDADVWAYGKMLFEMACGVPTSLVKDDADPETNMRDILQDIAGLQGDIVSDGRMRFPVLRSVLRETLKVETPRMAMNKIVNKGLWSGAETSSLGQESDGQSVGADGFLLVPEQSERMSKSEKRVKAIQELIETEKEYCKRLEDLVVKVVAPLRKQHEGGAVELEDGQLRVLTDLENLLRANKFFLSNLETRFGREGSSCIGQLMIEFARTLLMNYEIYVTRFIDSCELIQDAKRSSRQLQQIIADGVGDDASLNAYLILPVQRLMRYKLLLEAIVHQTPETGAAPREFEDLQEALAAVTDTVDKINDASPETLQRAGTHKSTSGRRRRKAWSTPAVVVVGAVGCAAIGAVYYYLTQKQTAMLRLQELHVQENTARHVKELEAIKAQMAAAEAAKLQAHAEAAKAQETTKVVSVVGALSAVAVLLLSDRRVKTRVSRRSISPSGLVVYRFAYVWEPQVLWEGVMAQDLLARRDAASLAVRELPGGCLAVDYSLIDVVPRPVLSPRTQIGAAVAHAQ